MGRRWWSAAMVAVVIAIGMVTSKHYGWDKEAVVELFNQLAERMGVWAIPAYVLIHTLTIALCLPYAVFFEAGASLLFGFFPAVLCIFSAKVLGASLSFWIGRFVFMSSSSAREWLQRSKHFHLLSKGVELDGWRFVLLARFSPVPSFVINYALAATKVGFFVDFLLPTVLGCMPMILQNTSLGSLAAAAVSSASGSQKSRVYSYIFPLLGITSSFLISLRIRKYSKDISVVKSFSVNGKIHNSEDASDPFEESTDRKLGNGSKKGH
ncbi:hypothetical protein Nepgr_026327 [Nepenthes gracilis]|uniref:VTT domain-containing protein n=1 Tax=Nepenthes gracilis TaxID=150966 RepID=A0AAD3T8V2_NEPGR|nr:hypothetical protein Nepgr_026327 [Nepenthes gracilis]